MHERTGVVSFKGDPLTLIGDDLAVGDKAPDFSLRARDMSTRTLGDYAGKVKILSVAPSLDTPTCAAQLRVFNTEAASLSDEIVVLTVTRDLPFAQTRFCETEGIDKVEVLSDFVDGSFGKAYGLYLKEWELDARAVLILDRDDVVRYVQIVPSVEDEPVYAPILGAVQKLL
jgi:thiol peroxidase